MKVLLPVLFSAIALFAQDPQTLGSPAQVPDNLTIPARLSKSIDTNKCKAGDPVELKTLEPVLIANGVVMPENAKLHGRILGAASRQDDKPSWVVLVVEQAEWKQHTVPLHAFATAQIVSAPAHPQKDNAFDNAIMTPDTLNNRHAARNSNPGRRAPAAALTRSLQDAPGQWNDARPLTYHGLDDLRFLKGTNGTIFMVSEKPHLKLPSGVLFMLRNQAVAAQPEVASTKVGGNPQ